MRYIYGVFIGSSWAMVSTRAQAWKIVRRARTLHGTRGLPMEIRRLPEAPYRDAPGCSSFDAPTFRVLSSSIWSN